MHLGWQRTWMESTLFRRWTVVHPCPRFHYDQAELNGIQFGVIVILRTEQSGRFSQTRTLAEQMEPSGHYCVNTRYIADATPATRKQVQVSRPRYGSGFKKVNRFPRFSFLLSSPGRKYSSSDS